MSRALIRILDNLLLIWAYKFETSVGSLLGLGITLIKERKELKYEAM